MQKLSVGLQISLDKTRQFRDKGPAVAQVIACQTRQIYCKTTVYLRGNISVTWQLSYASSGHHLSTFVRISIRGYKINISHSGGCWRVSRMGRNRDKVLGRSYDELYDTTCKTCSFFLTTIQTMWEISDHVTHVLIILYIGNFFTKIKYNEIFSTIKLI